MCRKKCKNVECDITIPENRTYCSLKCRNVYVNKHVRDYSKIAESLSQDAVEAYEAKPKLCKCCGKKIPYEKRRNTYCNSSCQSSVTSKERTLSETVKQEANRKRREKLLSKDTVDCLECGTKIRKTLRRKFCSDQCRRENKRKHLSAYAKYKADAQFTFNLSDFPDEFNFDLIREYGWYKPKNRGNNIGGVSRDHIFSVKEGFEKGVDPKLISHPANCRLMIHSKNISKNKRSDISLSELKEKISSWNSKYGGIV